VLWFAGIFMFAGTAVKSGDWKNMNWNNVNWSVNWNDNDRKSWNDKRNFITETRDVADFKRIDISGNFEITIDSLPNQQLVLNACKDFMSKITTKVRGETLVISYPNHFRNLRNPVKISLSTDMLEKITARGATTIKSNSTIKSENFSLNLRGASTVILDVEIENKFKIDASGASTIRLRGKSEMLELRASGASTINVENLKAEHVDVNISGAGSAYVYASKSLNANASGISNIVCYGNPENVRKSTSGMSSVRMR